jgi:hypothetical protein
MLWLLLIAGSPVVQAQQGPGGLIKRLADQFLHDTLPPAQPRYLVFPTLAYAPETVRFCKPLPCYRNRYFVWLAEFLLVGLS